MKTLDPYSTKLKVQREVEQMNIEMLKIKRFLKVVLPVIVVSATIVVLAKSYPF